MREEMRSGLRAQGSRNQGPSSRTLRAGEKTVLPGEIEARPLLLLIPAIGLAQAVLERREIETELRACSIVAGHGQGNIKIHAKVERLREQLPTGLLDLCTWDADDAGSLSSDLSQQLQVLDLRNGRIAGKIVRPPDRPGLVARKHGCARDIPNVDPLHPPRTILGYDDRPAGKQAIPEERFAIERVVRPVDERRPQRGHRNAFVEVQVEQRPFALRFLSSVAIWIIGGHEWTTLVTLALGAVDGDAGREDITTQTFGRHSDRGGTHLLGTRTPLPVVDVVIDNVESAVLQCRSHGRHIVAVALQFCNAAAERRAAAAMHDHDLISTHEQLLDERTADEECPSDDECACHESSIETEAADTPPEKK